MAHTSKCDSSSDSTAYIPVLHSNNTYRPSSMIEPVVLRITSKDMNRGRKGIGAGSYLIIVLLLFSLLPRTKRNVIVTHDHRRIRQVAEQQLSTSSDWPGRFIEKKDQCSQFFCTRHLNADEMGEPLDKVRWNSQTKRYEMMRDYSNQFLIDDVILQGMVMLFVVARIQHGWKHAVTCAQLTTWPTTANSGIQPQYTPALLNEWDEEMQELIRTMKMTRKFRDSANNYNNVIPSIPKMGVIGRKKIERIANLLPFILLLSIQSSNGRWNTEDHQRMAVEVRNYRSLFSKTC